MSTVSSSDLTGRARIRNAALRLFGERGAADVSIRAVAKAAGVSAGLVIHHFESRDGLVAAVDEYLVERVSAVFADLDLVAGRLDALSSFSNEPEILVNLARVIVDDGPASRTLFDRLNEISRGFVAELTASGAARAVDDPDGVAAWLLAADIGLLVLRHHLARTLSADPLERKGIERFAALEVDLLANPLLRSGSDR